jgi:hypothetical protein
MVINAWGRDISVSIDHKVIGNGHCFACIFDFLKAMTFDMASGCPV